jgi:hypothetical protein
LRYEEGKLRFSTGGSRERFNVGLVYRPVARTNNLRAERWAKRRVR